MKLIDKIGGINYKIASDRPINQNKPLAKVKWCAFQDKCDLEKVNSVWKCSLTRHLRRSGFDRLARNYENFNKDKQKMTCPKDKI